MAIDVLKALLTTPPGQFPELPGCEFCPAGGGGCGVCGPAAVAPACDWCGGPLGESWAEAGGERWCLACDADEAVVRPVGGLVQLVKAPEDTASVRLVGTECRRVKGRPVPPGVVVEWEPTGLAVSGPAALVRAYCRP